MNERETAFSRVDAIAKASSRESIKPRKRAPFEQSEYMERWMSG